VNVIVLVERVQKFADVVPLLLTARAAAAWEWPVQPVPMAPMVKVTRNVQIARR
jgi:hypothetical protein